MTYFNRKDQLLRTLASFEQYNPDDFFVVIVDDKSDEMLQLYCHKFKIHIITIQDKKHCNPCIPFNHAILWALSWDADTIILQNAECCHMGDILDYVKKNLNELNYISFGCYSQGKDEAIGSVINPKGASFDGESAWYNHPIYRPVGYHFCSAITANNITKLNGFDERFAGGIAFDDDYFLYQIRCLGLNIEIIKEPIVIHQWHEPTQWGGHSNEALYKELVQIKSYRAQHLFTKDL